MLREEIRTLLWQPTSPSTQDNTSNLASVRLVTSNAHIEASAAERTTEYIASYSSQTEIQCNS